MFTLKRTRREIHRKRLLKKSNVMSLDLACGLFTTGATNLTHNMYVSGAVSNELEKVYSDSKATKFEDNSKYSEDELIQKN